MRTGTRIELGMAMMIFGTAIPAHAQYLAKSRLGLSAQGGADHRDRPMASLQDSGPTHWKEGMIVGGVVGLAAGFAANSFIRSESDASYGFSYMTLLLSTFAFSIIGGLIGSASHKS